MGIPRWNRVMESESPVWKKNYADAHVVADVDVRKVIEIIEISIELLKKKISYLSLHVFTGFSRYYIIYIERGGEKVNKLVHNGLHRDGS
jgi:hypothetical protein